MHSTNYYSPLDWNPKPLNLKVMDQVIIIIYWGWYFVHNMISLISFHLPPPRDCNGSKWPHKAVSQYLSLMKVFLRWIKPNFKMVIDWGSHKRPWIKSTWKVATEKYKLSVVYGNIDLFIPNKKDTRFWLGLFSLTEGRASLRCSTLKYLKQQQQQRF